MDAPDVLAGPRSEEFRTLLDPLLARGCRVLLLARLVTWFFRRHYSIAFHGIFGIVLASTLVIIPTSYVGAWEIVLSAVCCIGGFLLAYFMARLDRRIQENGRA